jgi:hypothetical protein
VEFCGYKAGENKEREEAERDKKKSHEQEKKRAEPRLVGVRVGERRKKPEKILIPRNQ